MWFSLRVALSYRPEYNNAFTSHIISFQVIKTYIFGWSLLYYLHWQSALYCTTYTGKVVFTVLLTLAKLVRDVKITDYDHTIQRTCFLNLFLVLLYRLFAFQVQNHKNYHSLFYLPYVDYILKVVHYDIQTIVV